MKKSYFITLPIGISILVFTMYVGGGSISLFINPPSFLLSIFLSIVLVMSTFNPPEIVGFFVTAFRKDETNIQVIRNGIHFFSTLQSYLIFSAFLGFILGVICMLANLDDPDSLGPGVAVSLLTVLYSMTFMLLITIPFKAGLRKRLIETAGTKTEEQKISPV